MPDVAPGTPWQEQWEQDTEPLSPHGSSCLPVPVPAWFHHQCINEPQHTGYGRQLKHGASASKKLFLKINPVLLHLPLQFHVNRMPLAFKINSAINISCFMTPFILTPGIQALLH